MVLAVNEPVYLGEKEDLLVALVTQDGIKQLGEKYPALRWAGDAPHTRLTRVWIRKNEITAVLAAPGRREEKDRRSHLILHMEGNCVVALAENDPGRDVLRGYDPGEPSEATPWGVFSSMLEYAVKDDLTYLMELEHHISSLEEEVLSKDNLDNFSQKIASLRKELLHLHMYYTLLSDGLLGRGEEEDGLYPSKGMDDLGHRIQRLEQYTAMLRESSLQLRELYQAQVDLHLNKVMKLLTVVTTIFLPLTLIVGWYGMNFTGMRELNSPYGYPICISVSVLIVVGCIVYFKKNKYL